MLYSICQVIIKKYNKLEDKNMLNMEIFTFEEKNIRILIINSKPWWVLLDVCETLSLGTPSRVAERLDEDEVSQTHVIDKTGRQQKMLIINESGLYNVLIRSDKPNAKVFRRWVTHDVLPDIREKGSYTTNKMDKTKLSQNMQLLLQMANTLADQEIRQAEMENKLMSTTEKIEDVEKSLSTIKEVIISREEDWKSKINTIFNKIVKKSESKDYKSMRIDTYYLLENRAKCNLNTRLANKKNRLRENGATESVINDITKLCVIEDDPRLKEIYTTIIKEYYIKYCA
jgi:prophage antirepressor-like protein